MEFLAEFWWIWVVPTVGGLLWWIITTAVVKAPGKALRNLFVSLGTLTGKTYKEIVNTCGAPNAISTSAEGVKICQWIATGFHIVLLFDNNDICLGISSETTV